jgi:hypothetical protein
MPIPMSSDEMDSALLLSPQEIDDIYTAYGVKAGGSDAERRTSERRPYPAIQWLAPYGAWGLPTMDMFREIRCHDLSQGGVSFFLPRPPQFHFAVIGLGKQPDITYLLVRILYSKEYTGGRKEYLVGCCFVQRVTIRR